MEFPYPISETLLQVLMLEAVGMNYPGQVSALPSLAPIFLLWLAIRSSGGCQSP